MKSEYSKYDWISWGLFAGWATGFILLFTIGSWWPCILIAIFMIGDWIFTAWDKRRKEKLFTKRILECNETFQETIDILNKLTKE
jgi:hypothetical protein